MSGPATTASHAMSPKPSVFFNVLTMTCAMAQTKAPLITRDFRDIIGIREVDVVFRDDDHAFLRAGLSPGDQVVTTHLSTVTDGAPLRTDPAPDAPAGGTAPR